MRCSMQQTGATDLALRKKFIGLDGEAQRDLRKLKALLDKEMPVALDKFYRALRAEPAVAKFFSDTAHVDRAKGAQNKHWSQIGEGTLDGAYADRITRVGMVHARIGLEPRWYIGGYGIIVDHLIRCLVADIWPKSVFSSRSDAASADAGALIATLVKTILLDVDIALSVYFDASEAARVEAEQKVASEAALLRQREEELRSEQLAQAEALSRERAGVVAKIGDALAALADRNLTLRLDGAFPLDYVKLQSDFNIAVEKLREALLVIHSSAQGINSGTREIAAAADDLARRTEQQAAALEETVATVRSISDTIRNTADSTGLASRIVSESRADAERSGAVVGQAVDAMGRIERSSQEIGQIISVIDEIAFQTNLLALNAGVEAARAGEAGRGFAVVAAEVRALAQRAAEAAKQIKDLIGTSSEEVSVGVRLVSEAGRVLGRIVEQINEINTAVSSIALTARDEAESIQQINAALADVDKATQQNAAMAEEASAAGRTLSSESQRLSDLVSEFQLGSGLDQRLRSELQAAAPHMFSPERSSGLSASGASGGSVVRLAAGGAQASSESWEEF